MSGENGGCAFHNYSRVLGVFPSIEGDPGGVSVIQSTQVQASPLRGVRAAMLQPLQDMPGKALIALSVTNCSVEKARSGLRINLEQVVFGEWRATSPCGSSADQKLSSDDLSHFVSK